MEQSFSDISLYHEYRSARETEHLVSQKTWDDLNLDDFFEWADRTSSCVGRQYLYDVLHYNRLSEISEQEEVIRKLSADKELRAEIRSELRKLDTPDAYTIASLFSISHPVYSRRFYRLLTILQFAPFVLLGIVYITSSLYVLGILCTSVLVNMVLHYRSKARIQGYFFSIPQLWQLLRQAEKLAQIPLCASVHRDIQKTLQALHPLRKKLSTFRFSIRLESDIAIFAYFFTEIVNVFFLREVIPVSKAFFLLQGRQEQIEEVFRYFGLVDVLCSVSELRNGLPYYVLPEACSEGETFHAEGLYHPLIERCIPNDITLCGKSVLVTGSNMSGKTTFIRAIGLNLLSAQVLHTCFARSFRFPMDTALYSAIHLEDSLMEGKSFFLQEVQIVREMQGAGIDKMTVLGFDNAPVAVWIATAIGFLISVFVSFLLNSRFVFKLEEGKSRSFGKALLKTYLSYGVTGIVLNPVLNTVWVSVCHISDRIAPLISLVIAIPINFLMNKLWAFKAEE